MVYLWRAIDAEGEVLDILAPSERNKNAALKLMRKLLKKYGFVPDRTITDDLQSRGAAAYDFKIESRHECGRWKNNRVENSHQPTRRRERKMQRFKSPRLSAAIPFNARRGLQHSERPTPSRLCQSAPKLPRRGDE
jgi:putative transposase